MVRSSMFLKSSLSPRSKSFKNGKPSAVGKNRNWNQGLKVIQWLPQSLKNTQCRLEKNHETPLEFMIWRDLDLIPRFCQNYEFSKIWVHERKIDNFFENSLILAKIIHWESSVHFERVFRACWLTQIRSDGPSVMDLFLSINSHVFVC